MIKVKQIIALNKGGFIALDKNGSLYHVYQVTILPAGTTEWTWSQINFDDTEAGKQVWVELAKK